VYKIRAEFTKIKLRMDPRTYIKGGYERVKLFKKIVAASVSSLVIGTEMRSNLQGKCWGFLGNFSLRFDQRA
jgi:hypothetical protein